jgi:hypothetical protein
MDARAILFRGVATGLRLGRGTADRVVTLAGPSLGRLADKAVSRVRRPQPHTTTTFTPAKQSPPESATPEHPPTLPTPGTVARNIGPQRPTAKPAARPKPKSSPGAKLPPPRPRAT